MARKATSAATSASRVRPSIWLLIATSNTATAAALLVLASTLSPEPVLVTGLLAAAMIAVTLVTLRPDQPTRPR